MTIPHDVIKLPFETSTPSIARTKLAGFLTIHQAPSEAIDNALIVISEMIANAVCHGAPTPDGKIEISWSIRNELLEISVYDAGQAAALTPVDFDEDSLSGRGLSIISRIADSWWVDVSDGTRVNAELQLAQA